eukprot:jgi/Psemu1/16542/gm1.16542_g
MVVVVVALAMRASTSTAFVPVVVGLLKHPIGTIGTNSEIRRTIGIGIGIGSTCTCTCTCTAEPSASSTQLHMASKKKSGKKSSKKKSSGKGGGFLGGGGGGFGGSSSSGANDGSATATATAAAATAKPVAADKDSLETQWDTFAAITDLEIRPLGDPDDEDYEDFRVVDVFVRCGGDSDSSATTANAAAKTETGWFRIGKVCTSEDTPLAAALSLQKGLILWTAVHMRRELLARGKAAARALELGFVEPASITTGTETDEALDFFFPPPEEATTATAASCQLRVVGKASPEDLAAAAAAPGSFGFRPDWNPPGFTYKRRESAARKEKKKKSSSGT